MKVLINDGNVKFLFKDTDTVALTDTKLTATETDGVGAAVSWEDARFTSNNSQLIEATTAEDYILATWELGPRQWFGNSYATNMGGRSV